MTLKGDPEVANEDENTVPPVVDTTDPPVKPSAVRYCKNLLFFLKLVRVFLRKMLETFAFGKLRTSGIAIRKTWGIHVY